MEGYVDTPGARIRYQVDGPEDGPPVLLSNALGTTADMWLPQVEELQSSLRLIRYDTRGHGGSSAPAGEYTLEELGEDAMHVLDAVGVEDAQRLLACRWAASRDVAWRLPTSRVRASSSRTPRPGSVGPSG